MAHKGNPLTLNPAPRAIAVESRPAVKEKSPMISIGFQGDSDGRIPEARPPPTDRPIIFAKTIPVKSFIIPTGCRTGFTAGL
jgi:hypothetical protein